MDSWTEQFVQFNRCPRTCGYTHKNHAQLARKMDVKPELGDKLFSMDVDTYWKERNEHRQRLRAVKTKPQQILEYPERYIAQYPDVFSEEEFDQLPPRRPWDHAIELTPDFRPMNCKIYALTLEEQRALDNFLEENLRTGRIRPSISPMASPFSFVKKKDGKLRPVQDYRKLNEFTVKNRYPLPLIQELIDTLTGA